MSDETENSEIQNTNCVNPPSVPSFQCLWSIVQDFRNGNLNVTLARKVAGQLDAALSQIESDDLPSIANAGEDYTVSAFDRLADILPDTEADVNSAAIPWARIIAILIQLLQLLPLGK